MSAMKLAEYLKKKISESNLNQREISEKARITRQTLHRLQSGEVHEMKLSTMRGICYALKLDPMDVIGIYFDRNLL